MKLPIGVCRNCGMLFSLDVDRETDPKVPQCPKCGTQNVRTGELEISGELIDPRKAD